MKKAYLLLLSTLFLSNISYGQQLEITSWFRPNAGSSKDLAAEVCFKVTPAPSSLTHVLVEVDKTSRGAVVYNTFVGPQGGACLVVTSVRGTVEVSIPQQNLVVTQKL